MNWNYAKLSKMAKVNGGPEALVEKLIQNGISKGKRSMRSTCLISFVAGAVVCGGSKWLWNKFISHRGGKTSEAEIQSVKEELIRGIEQYDSEQTDVDEICNEDTNKGGFQNDGFTEMEKGTQKAVK